MSRFIQLHFLTVYPPSNPNRDDQGRPKSAIYGGVDRLRFSSQSIKRAARLSEAMQTRLAGQLGERTQRIGDVVMAELAAEGVDADVARKAAKDVTQIFGKFDAEAEKKGHVRTRQLAFVSPDERAFALAAARRIAADETVDNLEGEILRTADGAADVAMFGRMLADAPEYNREAAVQVSHPITTHRAIVEDDFYTAVDDLKRPEEDSGAGFVGEAGFGSGVFYLYACIDAGLLVENLAGDRVLAGAAAEALAEALATSTPGGKRASFAHQVRASYILAESGSQQPRSLAGAFLKPVTGDDLLRASIAALEKTRDCLDSAYGPCAENGPEVMDVDEGRGSLADIIRFVGGALSDG